ncbi:MAG: hypothetical protein OJF51_001964 [Nitrospira sp.]|nr:MAG: hypothetical protein OJF51_001964 [Nitrospira sp.]
MCECPIDRRVFFSHEASDLLKIAGPTSAILLLIQGLPLYLSCA